MNERIIPAQNNNISWKRMNKFRCWCEKSNEKNTIYFLLRFVRLRFFWFMYCIIVSYFYQPRKPIYQESTCLIEYKKKKKKDRKYKDDQKRKEY